MRRAPGCVSTGVLRAGALMVRCSIGRAGLAHAKREGDGATPCGRFGLLGIFYRADRLSPPLYAGGGVATRASMGWCDDPVSALYNRFVTLPVRASHERLWRDDGLYDLVVALDFNLKPRARGGGSAIFFHLTERVGAPTAGCVALTRADMRRLLPRLARDAVMTIK